MSRIVAISADNIQNSEGFNNAIDTRSIQGVFSKYIEEELLTYSGVCIFSTLLTEDETYCKLKELFQHYYKKLNGQIQPQYVVYEHNLDTDNDKLAALIKGKQLLKSNIARNRLIEENKELLFRLQPYVNKTTKPPDKDTGESFVEVINDLYPEGKSKDDTFRIIVVKVDLDGMGDLFAGIKKHSIYKQISEILNEKISLKKLGKLCLEQKAKNNGFRMYPFYAAGDDILFAVPVKDLLPAINLCKSLVEEINKEIGKLGIVEPPISVSIGIELSYNREPTRYYHNRVREQLEYAKKADVPEELRGVPHIRMAINNCVVYDYLKLGEEEKKLLNEKRHIIQWAHLRQTIKYIEGAAANGFEAHQFLSGLLQKIQDPEICKDELKLSNMVLYHLRPRHLESVNNQLRVCELKIIKRLLERVTVQEKDKFKLVFNEETCRELMNYIRLLLLFTAERFDIMSISKDIQIYCDKFEGFGELKRQVFFYPLEYLYENSLGRYWRKYTNIKNSRAFRDLFVRKSDNSIVFELLDISAAMLYRLKRKKADIRTAAEMLSKVENRRIEDYEADRAQKKKEKKTLPPLYFKNNSFVIYGEKYGIWGEDYLDVLIIFYEYYYLLSVYRRCYKAKHISKYKGRNYNCGKDKPYD